MTRVVPRLTVLAGDLVRGRTRSPAECALPIHDTCWYTPRPCPSAVTGRFRRGGGKGKECSVAGRRGRDLQRLADLELLWIVDVVGRNQLVGLDAKLLGDLLGVIAVLDDVGLVADRRARRRRGRGCDHDRRHGGLRGERGRPTGTGRPVQPDVEKARQGRDDDDEADDVRPLASVAPY